MKKPLPSPNRRLSGAITPRPLLGVLAVILMLCIGFGGTAFAQSRYGLDDLLRDMRSGLEKGLNSVPSRGRDTKRRAGPPKNPPLPTANPKRGSPGHEGLSAAQTDNPPVPAPQANSPEAEQPREPLARDEQPEQTPADAASPGPAPPAVIPVDVAREVPLPPRNPVRTGEMKLPPPHPSQIEAEPWSDAQIAKAKAQCNKLMTGDDFAYVPLAPIREGICGTPAPIKLSSIDAGGKVAFSPVPTMTCELAAQLRDWLENVVQPAAKAHLGGRVVRLRTMSSYSCRNAYNNAYKRLSHHALANALDIGSFETETGERIVLLKDWNQMVEVEPPPAETKDEPTSDDVKPTDEAKAGAIEDGAIAGVTKQALPANSASDQPSPGPQNAPGCCRGGEPPADGQGQAKDETAEPATEPPPPVIVPGPKQVFLRKLHDGACGIFGTVLGPAADRAHRNHFHFDAKGRRASYCR